MTARKQKTRSRYTPTYDYTTLTGWSMTPEEMNAILDKASECDDNGDEEGYDRWIHKLPLVPNMALMMLDDMGKEALLAEGFNLADAEIAYGKDWLDTCRIKK